MRAPAAASASAQCARSLLTCVFHFKVTFVSIDLIVVQVLFNDVSHFIDCSLIWLNHTLKNSSYAGCLYPFLLSHGLLLQIASKIFKRVTMLILINMKII